MIDTKALREKVLDLAIRGKLVPQDPNDEPASVLLERIRAEKERMVKDGKLKAKDIKNDTVIFKGDDNLHYEKFPNGTVKCIEDEIPFELPSGWSWCRLKSITEIITKGASPKWQGVDYTITGTLFVTSENVGNDTLLLEKPKYLNDKINEIQPRSILKKHDVLTNIVGASIGRTCEYTLDTLSNVNQAVAIVRLVDSCFSKYIVKCLNSKYCINLMFDNQVDMARANLSLSSLSDFLIPLPPIKEQNRIVKQIENIFVYAGKINASQKDINEIVGLTKSKILDLAIRGKLVPQNPDDEPASVLLKRIRAEKEELIKAGKIKRDKKESVIFKGEDNSYYQDLPLNWSISSLSEITTPLLLNDGDWILSDNMVPFGDIKLIQLGSVGFLKYADKGFKYLTPEMFTELNCTEIHSGYMLINRIVSDKMCACVLPEIEGKKITTVDTCWIAPEDEWFNLKYILFAISSPIYQSLVMLNSSGTTRKRISKSNLISLPLALPPLAEQKRIVDAIETAFAQLDEILNSIS